MYLATVDLVDLAVNLATIDLVGVNLVNLPAMHLTLSLLICRSVVNLAVRSLLIVIVRLARY